MKQIFLLSVLCLAGCVCLDPKHKQDVAPAVSTQQVIEQLTETKSALKEAGESNTKVGQQIDKALTLAEKLDKVLEYIENYGSNKNVIDSE